MRRVIIGIVAALLTTSANAQIPAGPGQQPGTLPPAYIPPPPPPPVAPAPVPSAVTPLPSPSYGVPPGVTREPLYGSRVTPTIRYSQPTKKRKKPRKWRGT
jgi:hypothetical protein